MLKQISQVFRPRSEIEQHIAVFGQTGSGKTTLLSTFYGWHQEPSFMKNRGYSLISTNTSQGNRLLSNFLKMKDNVFPAQTTRDYQSYKFDVKIRGLDGKAASIVWHDYPGEWWQETKEGLEGNEKIETFRSLLQSDIAFILCDGQELKNKGNRYFRELFKQFRTEIELQKEQILSKDKSLKLFPRTWVICLSKSDIFPDKDVYWFRDQILKSIDDELEELNLQFKDFVSTDSPISIGNDFLLLSSVAIDETGKITNPEHHVGIDLIPPISLILPVQRALNWAKRKTEGKVTIHRLLELCRNLSTNWLKYIPIIGNIFMLVDDEVKSLTNKLKEVEEKAKKNGDLAQAIIASFYSKLQEENNQSIYLSQKQDYDQP
ncbi:TRAFAC clade GTPase domain-containing protein [Geminocystis sp. CENA526]|uniref:TRAFAC clade GTPase domain-containing protein n=1 Tax=Geminocystis sp. CENA526 TaxID=1355871 RepID=UPI003D6E333D